MGHTLERIAIATALLAATPAPAQDTAAYDDRRAVAEARAAAEKAEAELLNQRVTLLGLKSDATGKTELKDTAGAFEGWLLSTRAIDEAAAVIRRRPSLQSAGGSSPIVLLAGDESFDLGLPAAMTTRLRYLSAVAAGATPCDAGSGSRPNFMSTGAFPLAAVGAILGALRTDTTISGFAGPDTARMVIAALASNGNASAGSVEWIVPGELTAFPSDSPLIAAWDRLQLRRGELAGCRAELAAQGEKTKAAVALLDGRIKTLDDFATQYVVAGAGVSPLVQAARVQQIASRSPRVLRVYVEKAGGSILNRRNLWTALGAPAVGITGGAVVGWRLSNPQTGALIDGGNLACRTQLTNMRSIQAGRSRKRDCGWGEAL